MARGFVEAAIAPFSRRNFRGTKVFEVCDGAGYSIGMLYKVYGGKSGLLGSVVIHNGACGQGVPNHVYRAGWRIL